MQKQGVKVLACAVGVWGTGKLHITSQRSQHILGL